MVCNAFPNHASWRVFCYSLNNRKILYAPSDFRDDKHFLDLQPATISDLTEKNEEEEAVMDQTTLESGPTRPKRSVNEILSAERLLIARIGKARNLNFLTEVSVRGTRSVYDAIYESESGVTVLEIAYSKFANFTKRKLDTEIDRARQIERILPKNELNGSHYIFAIMTDGLDDDRIGRLRKQVDVAFAESDLKMPISVEMFDYRGIVGEADT